MSDNELSLILSFNADRQFLHLLVSCGSYDVDLELWLSYGRKIR